jgi:hypothetical protein
VIARCKEGEKGDHLPLLGQVRPARSTTWSPGIGYAEGISLPRSSNGLHVVRAVPRPVTGDVADEAIDLLGPGYIQFGTDPTGHFRFIAVEGWMDCQSGRHDGRPCVEFTWEGNDESDPASGRGWAALEEDGSLRGHI